MRLAMVLVGLAAVIGFSDVPSAPASADPLNSAQATAAQLSQEVLDQAIVVHQLSVRYQTDRAETNYLGAEVASSQRTVDSLRLRSDKTESRLRQEALFSYTDEVPAASAAAQFGGNLVELAARSTYLSLTLGDVTATVLQLQTRTVPARPCPYLSPGGVPQRGGDGDTGRRPARSCPGRSYGSSRHAGASPIPGGCAHRPAAREAGLPVGNGIVNAVNQQLGTASPTNPHGRR